jgi:hypothetical protein
MEQNFPSEDLTFSSTENANLTNPSTNIHARTRDVWAGNKLLTLARESRMKEYEKRARVVQSDCVGESKNEDSHKQESAKSNVMRKQRGGSESDTDDQAATESRDFLRDSPEPLVMSMTDYEKSNSQFGTPKRRYMCFQFSCRICVLRSLV